MFIYSYWDEICKELSTNFNIIKAEEILNNLETKKWLVVKHDVETDVLKALNLAKIENKHGIKATYYVQADLLKKNEKYLQEIASLGHEVTYHYDVLDSCDGDYTKASKEFKKYLDEFSKLGFKVKTVCPHGNPIKIRNGWSSNKDFFKNKKVNVVFSNILDIVVHLPSILKKEYAYISDAGYSFKKIVNIYDNDKNNKGDIELGKNLISIMQELNHIILSTHPHRWESNSFNFVFKVGIFKLIRYIAKKLASIHFLKKIMSKYYYLAKRV
jgi:hypothetical protein